MTQREFVLKMEPGAENKSCYGGIRYCPHAYRDILPVPLEMCSVPLEMRSGKSNASAELCEKCWNQEMVLPAPAEKPMAQVNAFINRWRQFWRGRRSSTSGGIRSRASLWKISKRPNFI